MGLKPAWEQRVIRLTREQDDELRSLAQARGLNISQLIREAVEFYLRTESRTYVEKHKRAEEG